MVFDAEYLRRYPLAQGLSPDDPPAWLARGDTLASLGAAIGIDAAGLAAQVVEFNLDAAIGRDPAFHRGESAFDLMRGEPDHRPNPNLRPLGPGPYYAVELRIGTLGTKGGPLIDRRARVLDLDGRPIPGLHAAGNVSASIFGPSYPGAGATLGPATTFGRLAGETIVED